MGFVHSKGFKYFKNLIIGIGAALVMLGALYKIQSWQMPNLGGIEINLLTVGLVTEAILFAFLGIIGPEPDYYWEKLYPGLDQHDAQLMPLTGGPVGDTGNVPALNGEVVEQQLGGMLTELQNMSKSMSSLKALQEADFSGTSEQIRQMGNFYAKLNEAMADLAETAEDTKQYKQHIENLNTNLGQLNGVYGNMLGAMRGGLQG
ncbi:MAG: gliding motility protein GldL [Bacteroidota bacterium]